jgi:exosortase B
MSSVLSALQSTSRMNRGWIRWLPVCVGLLALYVPTFVDLAHGLWNQEEQMHGPIVLAVVLWLIWQRRGALAGELEEPRSVMGGVLLVAGLLLYILGRSQDIVMFEVGSLIPVLAGTILLMNGGSAIREFAFPLFYIVFMLPLPGIVVDALTGPLKHNVSAVAEQFLYAVGYPIARAGVVLSVGPYQLLVADACSGLHSLISMTAMGLLYVYLMGHRNKWRNGILIACLVPIAIAANIVRVIVLVLVTYHFGDEAGQGFIHDFSGIFLFVVGLLILFAIDGLLGRLKLFGSAVRAS